VHIPCPALYKCELMENTGALHAWIKLTQLVSLCYPGSDLLQKQRLYWSTERNSGVDKHLRHQMPIIKKYNDI